MKQSFRDLQVWHLAIELTELVYVLTADFPKHELFGLSSQMRRAAVSIPSNIAEGSARASRKDFRHFLSMAKGSTCELQTQQPRSCISAGPASFVPNSSAASRFTLLSLPVR